MPSQPSPNLRRRRAEQRAPAGPPRRVLPIGLLLPRRRRVWRVFTAAVAVAVVETVAVAALSWIRPEHVAATGLLVFAWSAIVMALCVGWAATRIVAAQGAHFQAANPYLGTIRVGCWVLSATGGYFLFAAGSHWAGSAATAACAVALGELQLRSCRKALRTRRCVPGSADP